jgi:peptidyl-prolyl cis-trans isomerase A (cyclophilin A)
MKKLFALAAGLLLSLSALAANPVVEMKTSQGVILIELDAEKAPKTVANFLQYAKDGFYNGTVFHRVIDGFMIQGGGSEPGMREKPTRTPIENEAKNGLKNVTGSLAMARTPNPHSAAAQFFINVANNGFLDYPGQDGWGYAVFGKVIQGMDVVQKIAKVKKNRQDIPLETVLIESVRLLPEAKPAK